MGVVIGIDIKGNNASIIQALKKWPILIAAIFFFNVGESMKKFYEINCGALEKIKDGEALTSKYT